MKLLIQLKNYFNLVFKLMNKYNSVFRLIYIIITFIKYEKVYENNKC